MKKYLIFILLSFISFAAYEENLMKAIKEDNVLIVKTIEKNGENIHIKDSVMGKNMLGLAIFHNSNEVAEYFIKNHKYMINEIADDNLLPIEDAVLKENEDILILLLKNGAEIRKKDGNNKDVYTLATRFGKGRMVKILRDYELKDNKKR